MTTHRVILRARNLPTAPQFNTYEEFGAQASAFKEARRLARGLPTRLRDLPRNQAASDRSGGSPGQASGPAERPGTAGRRGRCPAPRAAPAGGRGGPGGRRAAPAEAARAQGALPGGRDMLFHATPQDPKMASPAPTKPAGSEGSDPASRSLPCHSEAEFEFTGRGRLSQPTAFNPLVAPAERVRLRRADPAKAEGTRRWPSFQL